jgi:hypothetical protein
MEENRCQRMEEHELAKRRLAIEEVKAKTEVSLMKSLSDLGMPRENITELVKDL